MIIASSIPLELNFGVGVAIGIIIGLLISMMLDKWHEWKNDMEESEKK